MMNISPEKIKKILIINLGGMGDFLLSSPALKALQNHFTSAKIDFLVSPKIQAIAEHIDGEHEVFVIDYVSGKNIWNFNLFKSIMLLFNLKAKEYDLAVNMRTLHSHKSAIRIKTLINIIAPKLSAGRNTEERGDFFDVSIFESEIGDKGEFQYDIDTAHALGADVLDSTPSMYVTEDDQEHINQILGEKGIDPNQPIIGIHPGGMESRRWPLDNFVEVINKLSEKFKHTIVITGGPDEEDLAEMIQKKSKNRIVSLSGQLDFDELAALVNRTELFVSNDTGPMHIAAILQKPLVALFGTVDYYRYNPMKISSEAVSIFKGEDHGGLEAITVEEVLALSTKLLNKESKTHD